MSNKTLAGLRSERNAGPTPDEIEQNRRVQYDTAIVAANEALSATQVAVDAVNAAANLAAAQAAVASLSATISGAKSSIGVVRPDLP